MQIISFDLIIQNVHDESNLDRIISQISNLMLALQHIWTMSSYYSEEEHMEQLLHQTSFIFTEKVRCIVIPREIFKHTSTDAHAIATQCVKLLLAWKTNYLETRASIERSEVGLRWEFNKTHLFDYIDHCTRISNDISNLSTVFIEFENLLEKQLKSIILNPNDLDEMLKKVRMRIQFNIGVGRRLTDTI